MEKTQIRADYKELLRLTLTFLGERSEGFRACGATSHARFMSKNIYSLKMFLFREQFHLTARELQGVRDICIFIVRLYVKVWYGCPNAIEAPNQDFNFLEDLLTYATTDKELSNAVLNKFKTHLWYLSQETIALAFFDASVSLEEKRNMLRNLGRQKPNIELVNGRTFSNPSLLMERTLSDFVSHKTKNFFVGFGLSSNFLSLDPLMWEENDEYKAAFEFCRNLQVVNDNAERGVKFMKNYNRILTNDEEQRQFIMQIVETYKKKFPSHNKSALM